MVTNAYQGRFVLLRVKVIIHNRSLAFGFPSKPRRHAQAGAFEKQQKITYAIRSVSISLPHWQWELLFMYLSIYLLFIYLFWKNETSHVPGE